MQHAAALRIMPRGTLARANGCRRPVPRCRGNSAHPVTLGGRREFLATPLRATPRSDSPPSSGAEAGAPDADAYRLGAQHLKALLEGAAWDSAEAVRAELATYSPGMKLTLLTNCGSLAAVVAFIISWASGEDPLGGVTWSSASLQAATTGLLAACPLVAASLLSRTRAARALVPVLEDLHVTQASLLRPLVKDLSPSQLLICASSIVLPALMLLLPAVHGAATWLTDVATPEVLVPPVDPAEGFVQERAMVASAAGFTHAADTVQALSGSGMDGIPQDMVMQIPTAGHGNHELMRWVAVDSGGWAVLYFPTTPDLVSSTPPLVNVSSQAAAAAQAAIPTIAQPAATWADAASSAKPSLAAMAPAPAALTAHSLPLSPPVLLPRGVPDLGSVLQESVVGTLVEPRVAGLMSAVLDDVLALAPAIVSGFVAAYTVMRHMAPRHSQVWAIREALSASDRYFRLTLSMSRNAAALSRRFTRSAAPSPSPLRDAVAAPSPSPSPASGSDSDAERPAAAEPSSAATSQAVSEAFRHIALLWLLMRRRVCQMAYMLIALHCLFASVLWQATGDLSAPAACGLACALTELWLTQWEGERQLAFVPHSKDTA